MECFALGPGPNLVLLGKVRVDATPRSSSCKSPECKHAILILFQVFFFFHVLFSLGGRGKHFADNNGRAEHPINQPGPPIGITLWRGRPRKAKGISKRGKGGVVWVSNARTRAVTAHFPCKMQ